MQPAVMLCALVMLAASVPLASAAAIEDDCGSGGDARDTAPGAWVEAPIECRGSFPLGDEAEFYRFHAPYGTVVTVHVTPDDAALGGVACLYPPRWQLPTACGASVTAESWDPRPWQVRIHLCSEEGCHRFGRGDYTLRIDIDGAPIAPVTQEGSFLVGVPNLGPQLATRMGADADGIDGRSHELARTSTQRDFLRVETNDCDKCLTLHWRYESGHVMPAACSETPVQTLECRMPSGATHVVIGGRGGIDVAYVMHAWYAP